MSKPSNNPKLIAWGSDPSRAAPLSSAEYGQLIAGLERTVMPALAAVSKRLSQKEFTTEKLERNEALASLVVRHARTGMHGWIHFQVHRTFGPLMSSERVFWMYLVGEHGEPGRLHNLDDGTAVERIILNFEAACVASIIHAPPQSSDKRRRDSSLPRGSGAMNDLRRKLLKALTKGPEESPRTVVLPEAVGQIFDRFLMKRGRIVELWRSPPVEERRLLTLVVAVTPETYNELCAEFLDEVIQNVFSEDVDLGILEQSLEAHGKPAERRAHAEPELRKPEFLSPSAAGPTVVDNALKNVLPLHSESQETVMARVEQGYKTHRPQRAAKIPHV